MKKKHLLIPLMASAAMLLASASSAQAADPMYSSHFAVLFSSNGGMGPQMVYTGSSNVGAKYATRAYTGPSHLSGVWIDSSLPKSTALMRAADITVSVPSDPTKTCTFAVSVGGDGDTLPGKGPLFKLEQYPHTCSGITIEKVDAGGGSWRYEGTAVYTVHLKFPLSKK